MELCHQFVEPATGMLLYYICKIIFVIAEVRGGVLNGDTVQPVADIGDQIPGKSITFVVSEQFAEEYHKPFGIIQMHWW
jgi:hypothetical protein